MTNDPSQGFEPYVNGGAQSVYRAWYPDGGGNLTVRAGANLIGDVMLASPASYGRPVTSSIGYNSDTPGNWLWRQGSGSAAIGQAQPTAWWINFGTYVAGDINQPTDELRGFTGFGTLGGGNLSMDGRRCRPAATPPGQRRPAPDQSAQPGPGAGGGQHRPHAGRRPSGADRRRRHRAARGGALNSGLAHAYESSGSVTNLRGQTSLQAASFGRLDPLYGVKAARDTRALDLFRAADVVTTGGIALYAGDSAFRLRSLGDLAIEKADDPPRPMPLSMPYVQANGTPGVYGANTWFSLWTANTAIDLFSAGGNLTPIMPVTPLNDSVVTYSVAVVGRGRQRQHLLQDPAAGARPRRPPDLLAGDSIYGGNAPLMRSGASLDTLASPYRPAFVGMVKNGNFNSAIWGPNTLSQDGSYGERVLFAFGSPAAAAAGPWAASRFYAMDGDPVGVSSGRLLRFGPPENLTGRQWHLGAGAVRMLAGRDIVGSGSPRDRWSRALPVQLQPHQQPVHPRPGERRLAGARRPRHHRRQLHRGRARHAGNQRRPQHPDADQAAVLSLGPVVPGDTARAPASPCRPAWRAGRRLRRLRAATWIRPASPIRRGR